MTVSGSNLDSVAEPQITVTVVITTFYNDTNSTSSTTTTESQVMSLDVVSIGVNFCEALI